VYNDLGAELKCALCSYIEPYFSVGQGKACQTTHCLSWLEGALHIMVNFLTHLLHPCASKSCFRPCQYDLASRFPSARWTCRSWRGKNEVPLVCEPNENIFRTLSKYGEWKPNIAVHQIKRVHRLGELCVASHQARLSEEW